MRRAIRGASSATCATAKPASSGRPRRRRPAQRSTIPRRSSPNRQVEFRRRLDDIEAYTQIVVSPEDDIELRRIRITNRARVERTIDITSYAEVVLASAIGDSLHPAFGNLFVQTEILADRDAILATRRRRSSEEPQRWMMHLLALHDAESTQTSFESDRLRFIGRGNDAARPAAVRCDDRRCRVRTARCSIRCSRSAIALVLQPDQSAVVDLVLGVAENREQCVALVEKYRDRHLADRAIEIAWTHNRIALGQINISEVDAQAYARLAGAILYADPARRATRVDDRQQSSGAAGPLGACDFRRPADRAPEDVAARKTSSSRGSSSMRMSIAA